MNNLTNEVFVSIDVEADGPYPGINSMLSFGAAAFNINKEMLGTFTRNLVTLPNASPNVKTQTEFWDLHPEEYARTRSDLAAPHDAFMDFKMWLGSLRKHGAPVFVAYPARYDIRFIDYYSWHFLGQDLLGFSCIDAKTYATAVLKCGYRDATKKNMPREWFPKTVHNHVALDDAIEQGQLFISMVRQNLGMHL